MSSSVGGPMLSAIPAYRFSSLGRHIAPVARAQRCTQAQHRPIRFDRADEGGDSLIDGGVAS